MPSVEDFKQSVSEMDDDELDSLLDTTRNDRVKRSKSNSSSKSKSSSDSKSEPDSLDDLDLEDLTPEQAQAIINKLQDG